MQYTLMFLWKGNWHEWEKTCKHKHKQNYPPFISKWNKSEQSECGVNRMAYIFVVILFIFLFAFAFACPWIWCMTVCLFVCVRRLCCYRRKHKSKLLFCFGVSFMLQRPILLRFSWSSGIIISFSSAISCLFLHMLFCTTVDLYLFFDTPIGLFVCLYECENVESFYLRFVYPVFL